MPKPKQSPSVRFNRRTGEVVLTNAALELYITTRPYLNPQRLVDRRSGLIYANKDYCYGAPTAPLPRLLTPPQVEHQEDGSIQVEFRAHQQPLVFEHRFRVTADALEEQLTVNNSSPSPISLRESAFGFTRALLEGDTMPADVQGCRFCAIPYRRETVTGEFQDYTASDLLTKKGFFHFWSFQTSGIERRETSAFGSEGWAWVSADGDHTLLLIKYNPEAMEWSLMEPVRGVDSALLRFGGAGLWKLGDPEPAAVLQPGDSWRFGTTTYVPCRGGWKGAFRAFRDWMEARGHRVPEGYNPPVHWNELYDNPLWWGPDTPERRQEVYQLSDMQAEAEKATEIGCEALYLDPGWDTLFASSIWAQDRLGEQTQFVRMLEERYGLKLALHNPLAAWCDINGYPLEARRKDKDGQTLASLCSASPAYLQTKGQRLLQLCRDGASFLMYDGAMFTGDCYDETHGHSLPLTRHEHCMAYLTLIETVKREFPDVLIELHDPVTGGMIVRYAPTYFLLGLPYSFDDLWGYEYMWDPMDDLRSGRSLSLYYVNLAYSIPIYLHIDLRKDNEHALMFWWYASTCRHLGVGGKHPDPKVWEAHKRAMQRYRSLKPFYTQGRFFGLDETVHAHTLSKDANPALPTVAVLNVFNLAETEVEREIRFSPSEIGLPDGIRVRSGDTPCYRQGEQVTLWVRLPALGHQLVLVEAAE